MGKVLGYFLAILITAALLINAFADLFQAYGWALFYVPALAVGSVAGVAWTARWTLGREKRRELKRAAMKRRIAELEAAQGIPVLTEGSCPACGAPLMIGAKYCSACRESVAPPAPRICYKCQTRNCDDAVYCGACGAHIGDDAPALGAGAATRKRLAAPTQPPARRAASGVALPTSEWKYHAWIAAHPLGWVINARRDGRADMTLHRATCRSIQPREGLARVGGAHIKACSSDPDALAAWASMRPETLWPCRMCRPERAQRARTIKISA